MYSTLLSLHSLFRWLVLASLLIAIFRAYRGYTARLAFTASDNSVRHWTATISHVQLILGFTLYFISPVVEAFRQQGNRAGGPLVFFGVIHITIMLLAVVLITVGSAMAKRQPADRAKFRTMLIWFSIALVIIFLAIPWPFSPLANRPYIRTV
ncbi:hypothetical protein [Spirosoma utsteinense]|uniref:Magnesium-transporting ATPase (P-type) n=1 Tax=Spirosoma utsteinense TaxID=2585773 RepID=A0ABR6WD48_9BACT|nr:hypothetical protein [Spirosoma utsteinense]MBC3788431.1 magnesium-transporting ATPase (P-type) [Spirosoma utsteinense]MBC3794478.1 magnesium-transporting ATPase (P-type) [Spirosoma utsteinense]